MIYAQAGTTVEAFLIGAPEGLLPGLEWALVDPTDGSYDIPRSGDNLSNPIPDIYRVTFTSPAVPDTYLIRWYSGVTVLADEELVVTSGPPDPPAVVGDDLVVRADLDARQIKYVDAAQADAAIADASATYGIVCHLFLTSCIVAGPRMSRRVSCRSCVRWCGAC